jgi:hypothetical protein
MRYMPTSVRLNSNEWHQIYLARGKDRAGNPYADPTKINHELIARREAQGRKGH